ncbi:hypothetical protein N8253_01190 [Pelagibacterales bacterium]|nr:hypothetical protein [Pelagibacterales bacterium]|tara:strand:+ start:83 stop:679 length:597 start_codon:yes stop_codon:yes gene_type:complete
MLPAHYAITEILIVVATYFSVKKLFYYKNYYAAIGILLIGITAFIGAIRFGLVSTDFMVYLNRVLAVFAGIITMSLISIQIVNNSFSKKLAYLLLAISILTFLLLFVWTQPVFKLISLFIWSFAAILLTFQIPQKSISLKFLKSLTMAILLIAFLTLSKGIGLLTDLFLPSVSFHIYHILIALWVFLISYSISQEKIN